MDARIQFWEGDSKALPGEVRLIHTPGHFAGFQVLQWPAGADGRGALFSGDQPQVCADPNWVSFMWSYPNYIPLGAEDVRKIAQILEPVAFDRIYGAFPHGVVDANSKEVMARSVERYLGRIAKWSLQEAKAALDRSPILPVESVREEGRCQQLSPDP